MRTMPMTDTEEMNEGVAEAIDNASHWRFDEKHPETRFVMMHGYYVSADDPSFAVAELDAYDPRLVPVLRALLERDPKAQNGDRVRGTFKYWAHREVVIPPEAHLEHQELQPYRTVVFDDTAPLRIYHTCVAVKFEDYTFAHTACGIQYVCDYHERRAMLRHAWLDTTYPGWRQRYDVASTLGFDAKTSAYEVFTKVSNIAQNPDVGMTVDMTVGLTGLELAGD